MENLKNQIKVLAEQQPVLKNQRKTVKLQGEKTMEPWQATLKHQSNRNELRKLYMEYGILKGKKPEEIQSTYKDYFDETFINQLIERYNAKAICSDQK